MSQAMFLQLPMETNPVAVVVFSLSLTCQLVLLRAQHSELLLFTKLANNTKQNKKKRENFPTQLKWLSARSEIS